MPRDRKRRADQLDAAGADQTDPEFSRWLKARGVIWSERRVATTNKGVVAGYGCVATVPIKRGEELFRVPRAACLGAVADEADAGVVDNEKDSQSRMALVLAEASEDWAPFVKKLTPAPCPWLWPAATQQRLFAGTELAPVLAMKREVLAAEYAALPPAVTQRCSLPRYVELCALAASHMNPWFGGSIVPFNTTLNYSLEPNVAFEPKGTEFVVGIATRKIGAGEELTQEYADATSELVYKYGPPRLSTRLRCMVGILPAVSRCTPGVSHATSVAHAISLISLYRGVSCHCIPPISRCIPLHLVHRVNLAISHHIPPCRSRRRGNI